MDFVRPKTGISVTVRTFTSSSSEDMDAKVNEFLKRLEPHNVRDVKVSTTDGNLFVASVIYVQKD
ncbi:sporulation protein Cse60 [Alicyclobacillus sp. SO9]|uniref:sporulation protein Cse60 n=1 Tax=Alicyclobacillus sp. SO9 TaxID=2665646 RepID=UPI0018E77E07|nr:sporulation protein Cse60 [Alicyclobacillus sp. SO9]QQE78683.1 sporulation protein Cse60 [Alicyclobacillus sp. SO9]